MSTDKIKFAEKLKDVIRALKLSKKIPSNTALASAIGVSPSALSEIISGRNHIPVKLIVYLENNFLINTKYIFNDDENMFNETHETNNPILIPIYEVESLTGMGDALDDNKSSFIRTRIGDPTFADCSIGAIVRSEAMASQIMPGDRVMLKRIIDYDIIPFGEPFLIVTAEQLLLRYLRKSERDGFWRLTAANPDFDDIDIPINKVTRIYQVKGITSRIS